MWGAHVRPLGHGSARPPTIRPLRGSGIQQWFLDAIGVTQVVAGGGETWLAWNREILPLECREFRLHNVSKTGDHGRRTGSPPVHRYPTVKLLM